MYIFMCVHVCMLPKSDGGRADMLHVVHLIDAYMHVHVQTYAHNVCMLPRVMVVGLTCLHTVHLIV
jgi:hypothetical protein